MGSPSLPQLASSGSAGADLDSPLAGESRALRLAEGSSYTEDAPMSSSSRRSASARASSIFRKDSMQEERAIKLAEGKISDEHKAAIADGLAVDDVVDHQARAHHHKQHKATPRHASVGKNHPAFQSMAMRLAEGKLSRGERESIARGRAVSTLIKSKQSHLSDAIRIAEGKLSDSERKAIAGGDAAPHYLVDTQGDRRQSEAERLAEGRISDAERRAIAGGSPEATFVRGSGDARQSTAERLAEGRLSGAEKLAIAGGSPQATYVLGSEDARQSEAERLAEGHVTRSQEILRAGGQAAPRSIQVRDGARESEAVRLAEGRFTRGERRTMEGGRAASRSVSVREGNEDEAIRLAEGGSIRGGDYSAEERAEDYGAETAGGSSSEALRLAEGREGGREDRLIAGGGGRLELPREASGGMTASRHVDLSDLSDEERSRRVQRLLGIATRIATKAFKDKSPYQQLAQLDTPSAAEPHPSSAIKQRKIEDLVQRVDGQASGMIQNPGASPSEWSAVESKVLEAKPAANAAKAAKGTNGITNGAQVSLGDVSVPLDKAVRRGWGGL